MPEASSKRRTPGWARWCIALVSIVVVAAGGTVVAARVILHDAVGSVSRQNLLGTLRAGTARSHATVSGAKNILLVGLDTRAGNPAMLSRSDSIILVHIAADHCEAYLVSLPRDSYVTIPPYDNGKVSYPGGKGKINAAYAYGSRGLTGASARSHGFELLARTVKELTGITPDAAAIIDFQGFQQVVQILGQVCMYVDEDTTSIHLGHTASGQVAAPFRLHSDGTVAARVPGVTPNFYAKGNHCFTPAEALDFVRQRDLLANHDADYGRQRHQQQFLKAILTRAEQEPAKLPGLLEAFGRTVTLDDGGVSPTDWLFAMRGIRPSDLVTVKTNDGRFNSRPVPGVGSVEILSGTSMQLLRAVRDDDVAAFLKAHPDWVSTG